MVGTTKKLFSKVTVTNKDRTAPFFFGKQKTMNLVEPVTPPSQFILGVWYLAGEGAGIAVVLMNNTPENVARLDTEIKYIHGGYNTEVASNEFLDYLDFDNPNVYENIHDYQVEFRVWRFDSEITEQGLTGNVFDNNSFMIYETGGEICSFDITVRNSLGEVVLTGSHSRYQIG
ncbi:hypothetical protein [Alishewanella phage vB_AspM_Slickus01]|nr:hypothetical protein [Alishewanella phage vB_AspM_Slickus01]